MICYRVAVNGVQRCLAGLGNDGVVSFILSHGTKNGELRLPPRLRVGGLDSEADEHVIWLEQTVTPGDLVSVEITNAEKADSPFERRKSERSAAV